MDKLKRVTIKEELVALTENYIEAIILNQFIYWSERVRDFDKYILEEKRIAELEGKEAGIDPCNGWIYKKCEELSEEIMIKLSPSNMRNHIQKLVNKGWLDERNNPNSRWDKVKQYRVNLLKIHIDLLSIGYSLQEYKIDMQLILGRETAENRISKTENRDSKTEIRNDVIKTRIDELELRNAQNRNAIPEITTEITLESTSAEITTESTSVNQSDVKLFEGTFKDNKNANRQTEDSRYAKIINNCQVDLMDDRDKALAVEEAVKELYFNSDFAKKVLKMPLERIRSSLDNLNRYIAEDAIRKMKMAAVAGTKIESTKHYLMTCIFNNISEHVTDLFANSLLATEDVYDSKRSVWSVVNGTELQEPLKAISLQLSEIMFNSWFGNIVNMKKIDSMLFIITPSELHSKILRERYTGMIIDAFKDIGITEIEYKLAVNVKSTAI